MDRDILAVGAASPTQNTPEKYLALPFGHRTVLKSDFELLSLDIY